MAYTPNKRKQNNAYKMGKLSRKNRFSHQKVDFTLVIVLVCLVATFVFAIILGNYLGDKAEQSQNTTTQPGGSSSVVLPDVDKVAPQVNLHAFFADMSDAHPEISLSEQTSSARDKGNALFFELRYKNGDLMYSSAQSENLDYPRRDNLTIDRLANHFSYYVDFAVGEFKSDFSSSLSANKRIQTQSNEITLLAEAAEKAFGQLYVSFSEKINKDNVIYYQAYLLDLKLACPDTPIGIKLDYGFITDSDNSGTIAKLLGIADFYVLDVGSIEIEALNDALAPLVYFSERYNGVIVLSGHTNETLSQAIEILNDKNFKNYIVK